MRARANKHWNADRRYFRRSIVFSSGSVEHLRDLVCDEIVEMCAEDGMRIPRSMRGLVSAVAEERRKNIAANRGLGYTPLSEAFDKSYVHPKSKSLRRRVIAI